MENHRAGYEGIGESAENPIIIEESDREDEDSTPQDDEYYYPNEEEELRNEIDNLEEREPYHPNFESENESSHFDDEMETDLREEREPENYLNTDSESEGEQETIDDAPDYEGRDISPEEELAPAGLTTAQQVYILIRIKNWPMDRDPMVYLSIIRNHADLYDLELQLQQTVNDETKTLVERILSSRRWRRVRVIADNSWRRYGNMYPDGGSLVIIYKDEETDWDDI
uniref:RNA-binding protein n=1 Tax=Strongyloides venezuelensis TaxID=75913 RepID=A0A0K0FZD8_STRVS